MDSLLLSSADGVGAKRRNDRVAMGYCLILPVAEVNVQGPCTIAVPYSDRGALDTGRSTETVQPGGTRPPRGQWRRKTRSSSR